MKKTTKTVALFAVLSIMTVGCQKEDLSANLQSNSMSESISSYVIQYTIDGVPYRITVKSEVERTLFINKMISLAENGHKVSFGNESQQNVAAKEVIHFSAKTKDEAYKWASKMNLDGYDVSIEFDEKTKTYNCTAIK